MADKFYLLISVSKKKQNRLKDQSLMLMNPTLLFMNEQSLVKLNLCLKKLKTVKTSFIC